MAGAGDHAGGDEPVHGHQRRDVLRVRYSSRRGCAECGLLVSLGVE